MTSRRVHRMAMVAVVLAALGLNVEMGETHKPITSKYTYNEDVFPILREHCGRCHIGDGAAPMSLMTYQEAFPWGESVRAEVIAKHMPPWHAGEGTVRFKNQPTITSADINKLLVWVSGGSPQGNPQNAPPQTARQHDWPLGKPDLVLALGDVTLDPETNEVTRHFTVATGGAETRWIRAVDLLPGTPAIVRDAIVSITSQPAATSPVAEADVLAAWVPGEDPIEAAGGAFRLPAQAELDVSVHYRKTFSYSGREMKDRSRVGLYFAAEPANEIRRLTVGASQARAAANPVVSFSAAVDRDVRALAFRPDPSLSNVGLEVDTVSADGARTPLIRLAVRPNWARRYWFDQPVTLRKGTRIEVKAMIDRADTLLPPAGTPLPPQDLDAAQLRVVFDVVAGGSAP